MSFFPFFFLPSLSTNCRPLGCSRYGEPLTLLGLLFGGFSDDPNCLSLGVGVGGGGTVAAGTTCTVLLRLLALWGLRISSPLSRLNFGA